MIRLWISLLLYHERESTLTVGYVRFFRWPAIVNWINSNTQRNHVVDSVAEMEHQLGGAGFAVVGLFPEGIFSLNHLLLYSSNLIRLLEVQARGVSKVYTSLW
jgi:hypothetical protein